MSSVHLEQEDIQIQIREKLRKDLVKLWMQPYYSDLTGPILEKLRELALSYAESLNIPIEACYEAIVELQTNSLENLKQNSRFKESGLATIKIKVLLQNGPPRMLTKELMLSMRACDLKELITKDINIPQDRLKLIYSGKVLSDSASLVSQGVKHGQKMIALTLAESPTEVQNKEATYVDLENFKTDSRLLANDSQYMRLEDQFGNVLKIPQEEKKALTLALALHAKGQAALKKNDYAKALVFFLESDEEFRRCNSTLLNSVDNYALVNLDIAWCYLCLQSVSQLPEAYDRLKKCEERFHKSYGPNLERLIAVKGFASNEVALFMRLHLLQAIALYHKNKRQEALELFERAQRELATLKVDENSVLLLVELGFATGESRLALRATQGDVNRAANYIKEKREKKIEAQKKALADEILEKKKKKLGLCKDGKQYVEPNFVKMLVDMGFNMEASQKALKECNNVISDSIQYIHEHPQAGPSQSKSAEFLSLINSLVPELEALGFDSRMVKLALHKHNADIHAAIEDLIENKGIIEGDYSILNLGADSLEEIKKKQKEKEEAYRRIADDIDMEDEDYLDLTLDQEENYLSQYLSLLKKK